MNKKNYFHDKKYFSSRQEIFFFVKIIRILPVNHIEIPTKLQHNKAKLSIQITSHSMLFLIFCSSAYYVLTRPLLLCYPVFRLPCLPHYIKFLNSKFTYMLLLHYLCGYGKYEPWGRCKAH